MHHAAVSCQLAGRFILSILLFLSALGEESSGQVLEEIVVTAQKREQSLQDVGISVTAFSGEQTQNLGWTSQTDVAAQTPGLIWADIFGGGVGTNALPSIRGVTQNAFDSHHEPPVAVYLDGAYISFVGAAAAQMYDIERVEVLRGPQGTLFGRNATGGLVHFIARKPTEQFEAYGEVTIAEFEQIKFEGAVSGPISDRFLGRLSVTTNRHSAFHENTFPGGEDRGTMEAYNARAQGLFRLTENGNLHVNLYGGKVPTIRTGGGRAHAAARPAADGTGVFVRPGEDFWGTCSGCDLLGYREPDDGDVHRNSMDFDGRADREFYGATTTVDWQFDELTLTSITNFMTFNQFYSEDTDQSPNPLAIYRVTDDADQFTQELRFNGGSERMRWVTGLYFLSSDGDFTSTFLIPVFRTPAGLVDNVNVYSQETDSWAVFGQIEHDFAPEWTAIAGLRWTREEKEFEFLGVDPVSEFVYLDFSQATVGNLTEQSADDIAFKLQIEWHPNSHILWYAGVTRGTKGPAFNAPFYFVGPDVDGIRVGGETVTSIESGVKSTLLDGRLRLNASVFTYDYEDFQAFTLDNAVNTVLFNSDAESTGAELELTASPGEGWDLMFGVGVVDTEVIVPFPLDNTRFRKRELPMAPDLSLNGLIRKSWPAWNGQLAVQLDFNYHSGYFADVQNAEVNDVGSSTVTNARLSYQQSDGRWEVALFARNIADEVVQLYGFDSQSIGFAELVYAPPRWVGGQVRFNWN